MIRTQVQLTDRQLKALRQTSASTGRSIAGLIREGVDTVLASKGELEREERVKSALAVAGKFSSGRSDTSANHDRHLTEAFRQSRTA
jgi:hypothetical protein